MSPPKVEDLSYSEAMGAILTPEGSSPKKIALADAQVHGAYLPRNAIILHGRRNASKQVFSSNTVPPGQTLHFVQVMLNVSARTDNSTFANLAESDELHISRLSHVLVEELDAFWISKLSQPSPTVRAGARETNDQSASAGRKMSARTSPPPPALRGGIGRPSHPLFVRYPNFFDDLIAEHKYFKHIKAVFFPYAGLDPKGHLMQLVAIFDPSIIKSARCQSLPNTTISIPRSAKGINAPKATIKAA